MADKKSALREKISLAATLVSVGIIAIFLGYAMGQYAINIVAEPFRQPMPAAVERDVAVQVAVAQPEETKEPEAPVRETQPPSSGGLFRVQIGAFSSEENAKALGEKLGSEENLPVYVTPGPPYRVQVGAFSQRENALRLQEDLQAKGYETILVQ
ncbi:MAG: SPOR domain-containing protein [Limnochordia bacterium]|jgi:cell division septation protein DedD